MILGIFHFLKYAMIFGGIVYGWWCTGTNRETQLNVIHELAKMDLLDINYHHDTIFSNNSYNTDMTIE